MKITIKKSDIPIYFFFAAILFYFSTYFINNSMLRYSLPIREIIYLSRVGAFLLLMLSIVSREKITAGRLVVLGTVIGIGIIVSLRQSDQLDFLNIVLFMVAGSFFDIKRIFRFTYKINLFWLILIVSLAEVGLIENQTSLSILHEGRKYAGFTAHIAPILLFFTLIMYLGYKGKNFSVLSAVLFSAGAVFLYRECMVRSPFICTLVLVLLGLLLKNVKGSFMTGRLWKTFVTILVPLCVLIAVLLPVLYLRGNSFAISLNELVSSRIRLSSVAIKNVDFTLFGTKVDFAGTLFNNAGNGHEYFYIDSAYLKYFAMYGIVFMAVALFGYIKFLRIESVNKETYLVVPCIISLFYYIFDPQLMYIVYNPVIMVILGYILRKETVQRRKPLTLRHSRRIG